MNKVNNYDAMFFASKPSYERHPDRFCTIATLFGMSPKAADSCRVLELGCATGWNIIPMALTLPGSSFVGIDSSKKQIDYANETVSKLGIKNIEFHCSSILELSHDIGKFDYLICHGVYSWVSSDVQDKILDICRTHLNVQGVAYVSYNCLPGWKVRSQVREKLLSSSDKSSPPISRVKGALDSLKSWYQELEKQTDSSAEQLRNEIANILGQSASYIFHELLEENTSAVLLSEFMDRANKKGLKYLGDGCYSRVRFHRAFPARRFSEVDREQQIDYMYPLAMRGTLLVHREVTLQREIHPSAVKQFFISSALVPQITECGDVSKTSEIFYTSQGKSIKVSEPLVQAALLVLHEKWPASISFAQLLEVGLSSQLSSTDVDELSASMLSYFEKDFVDFYGVTPCCSIGVANSPSVSPFARMQASVVDWATNYRFEYLPLDPFERCCMTFLDGTNDKERLKTKLLERVNSAEIPLPPEASHLTKLQIHELVCEKLENTLSRFAEGAFF